MSLRGGRRPRIKRVVKGGSRSKLDNASRRSAYNAFGSLWNNIGMTYTPTLAC